MEAEELPRISLHFSEHLQRLQREEYLLDKLQSNSIGENGVQATGREGGGVYNRRGEKGVECTVKRDRREVGCIV